MLERVGGSLIALTVSTKEAPALACPSLTVTVIVAVPNWFEAGSNIMVRSKFDPANTTFSFGIRAGFDERALRFKVAGGESTSANMIAIGPSGVSSSVI